MEKVNKIYLGIIITCAVLVTALCGYAIYNHDQDAESDALRFKDEYEALNGKENANAANVYLEVNIPVDNPMIYKSPKEILDVLKEEDAVVYFGFASCPWCRNVVENLIDVAKEKGLDKVYYVDVKDIRDSYKFNGSVKPEQTKEGAPAYYDILDFFGTNLDQYYITDDNGNMYDTGVTRLYAPTVISVKNGKLIRIHEGTVDSQEDPYQALSNEEKDSLKDKLREIVDDVMPDSTCQDEGKC